MTKPKKKCNEHKLPYMLGIFNISCLKKNEKQSLIINSSYFAVWFVVSDGKTETKKLSMKILV